MTNGKKILITGAVIFTLVIGATALYATITEQWSGDATGTVDGINPFADWTGYIEPKTGYDSFWGGWYDNVSGHYGTFNARRIAWNSDSAYVYLGVWHDTTDDEHDGTFVGKFYNLPNTDTLYDTCGGDWTCNQGGGGTWFGSRDLP